MQMNWEGRGLSSLGKLLHSVDLSLLICGGILPTQWRCCDIVWGQLVAVLPDCALSIAERFLGKRPDTGWIPEGTSGRGVRAARAVPGRRLCPGYGHPTFTQEGAHMATVI